MRSRNYAIDKNKTIHSFTTHSNYKNSIKHGKTLAEAVRKTLTFFGRRGSQNLVKEFELFGQVRDMKNKTAQEQTRIWLL